MNNQPDQPNIYQRAAAELRAVAEDCDYEEELRQMAKQLETDAAARAETITHLQLALPGMRAENKRLRDNLAASVRDSDRLYTLLDALVNEPQPLGIDRENYQNALKALEEVK